VRSVWASPRRLISEVYVEGSSRYLLDLCLEPFAYFYSRYLQVVDGFLKPIVDRAEHVTAILPDVDVDAVEARICCRLPHLIQEKRCFTPSRTLQGNRISQPPCQNVEIRLSQLEARKILLAGNYFIHYATIRKVA
jgi:hypothetical protein